MPSRRRAARLPASATLIRPAPHIPSYIDASTVAPRAGLFGDAAAVRMADDMRAAGHREGGVTRDDLELLGWTPQQVTDLSGKARNIAQRLSEVRL
jgi:hypothetical protein